MNLTQMVLPHKVESDAATRNYGKFTISPLEKGFGLTLGNALRRVLLSSLQGAAVTSVRVSDVHHEFSPIPDVREDMTQFILQVKQMRVKLDGESARLRLEHRGEGTVTAADIRCPPEVQIINSDLYLFTVDNPNAHLEMEFEVRAGRGFSPSDERGRLPIGELPVDAIFSPVKRVKFEIEPARVNNLTNYDKLVLEIWTDGVVRPQDALAQAAQILMRHLSVVSGMNPDMPSDWGMDTIDPDPDPRLSNGKRSQLHDKLIEELDLSVRVFNSLKRTGITTIGDVLEMLDRGQDAMLAIRNFGEKSLDELIEKLQEKGYLQKPQDDSGAAE
jgi:DNA-directed RNA polymerase subunit alpha